jgi:hypothetical protein
MMRKIRPLVKMVVFAQTMRMAQQGLNPTWVLYTRIVHRRRGRRKMRGIEIQYVHLSPCCDYFVESLWKMQADAYAPGWSSLGLERPDSMV